MRFHTAWVDLCLSPPSAMGSSLPLVTMACAGQVECKRLVSTEAIDWSVAMQMGGQVHAITQVEQQDWETPAAEDWVTRLNEEIAETDGEVVLVAHSLACTLITLWAQLHPKAHKVRGALLVAPSDTEADSYPSGTRGFVPMPMHRLPFPTITVASTDDPYVTQDRARAFSLAWGSELVWVENAGHINGQTGYGPWPEGVELMFKLTGDPQFQIK